MAMAIPRGWVIGLVMQVARVRFQAKAPCYGADDMTPVGVVSLPGVSFLGPLCV
jgi:hypothetical protein